MPSTFAYRVRDRSGNVVAGTLEADSQTLVVQKLRQMGYAPILIEEQKGSIGKKEIKLPFGGKVKPKQLAVMSRQFATMINSGLSLLRALNILAEQTESKKLAEVLTQVRVDVERGQSLSQALQRHPRVFGPLYLSLIRSGETGGVLDSVLLRLAETLEKEVGLRHKIKSAMTYPVAVFCLVILIMVAMLVFVVPTFKTLFSSLGGTLPLPTRALLNMSNFMKKAWYIVFAGLVGLPFGVKRLLRTQVGRRRWDAMKLRIPVFGTLFHKTSLSRFARTLSVLMRSGVPILQALDIVSQTVNNYTVSKAIGEVQASVKEGESLARPLERHAVFPPMVVQMMAVGEETGALDAMLAKISDFYDQEVDAAVESLTALIEPIMIAVMGGIVGAMVVALYMPMFNIINLIN